MNVKFKGSTIFIIIFAINYYKRVTIKVDICT